MGRLSDESCLLATELPSGSKRSYGSPPDGPRQLVAEDAQVLAYRDQPTAAEWLSPAEVGSLLAAVPSGNIPPDQARDFSERAVASLPALLPHLSDVADELAVKLRDDHIRVREAGAWPNAASGTR
jgi:hypothetical protein